jgi:calcineurin-like phosphoesterase family protein
MGKIFLTSDTHFGHNKPFVWEERGFSSVEEMNYRIIQNWNNIVSSEDTVYHLGDVMLGDTNKGIYCLEQLNGKIHIVWGNHCTNTRKELYKTCHNVIESCGFATIIKHKGYTFYLSHYPTITSNYDIDKPLKSRVINLCGHSHVTDPFADWEKGLIYHVELDAHNCYPVCLDDIIEDIKNKLETKPQ